MAKDKLLVPIKKNLFEDFLKNHLNIEDDVAEYFKEFNEESLRDINLILRRIKLSDNIHNDDIVTEINKGIGMFEDGALRMHLYLNCIEALGRMLSNNSFLTFGSWINAKKEPYESEKNSIDTSQISSDEKIVQKFHQRYSEIHGMRTMFYYCLEDGLTTEQKKSIFNNLFVIELNPLPKEVYHINHITAEHENSENKSFNRVAKERISWDKANVDIKTKLIAKALFKIRNQFTHSLIPYTSVQDKSGNYPISKDSIADRGDTVFVWNENIAIGSNMLPINQYLKQMVIEGLKNYVKKNKR